MKYISPIAIFLSLLLSGPSHADSGTAWTRLPLLPTVRTEVAAAVVDGKIFVVGGFTPQGITDQVEAWDPKTGRWETRAPLPHPLHHTTASALNGKLYVIGGFHSGTWTPVNTTYEYDPEKDRWKERSPMPTARGALARILHE